MFISALALVGVLIQFDYVTIPAVDQPSWLTRAISTGDSTSNTINNTKGAESIDVSSSSSSGSISKSKGKSNSSGNDSNDSSSGKQLVSTTASGTIDVAPAKALLKDTLSLIRHRYELDGIGGMFWLTANNIGASTWDVIKYKFARKIVDAVKNKQQFLMIFGGSSVTAGHDNYYNQSYPFVVERRLKPALEALGVSLLVHNIAQGANPCVPYSLCYETMGGLDPDFVGWEQSYNCGGDETISEYMARIAASASNRGVVYYSASGAWNPEKCPSSNSTPPYSSELWTPKAAGLDAWNPSHEDILHEKAVLDEWNRAHESSDRFTRWKKKGDPATSHVAAHGFNVWEPNPKCVVPDKEKGEKKNCGGMDAARGCEMKFMTHEAGLFGTDNGKGASWHPPTAFHLLRGEAIAWLYGLALMDAVYMVEADMKGEGATELSKKYQAKLDALQPPLGKPSAKCEKEYHCGERPICYTNFMPHHLPNRTLSELLVGNVNWTVDPHGTYGHVNLSDIQSEWSLKFGYLDEKPTIHGKVEHGEVHFRIKVGNARFVWVCGGIQKESLKHTLVYLDPNVALPPFTHDFATDEFAKLKSRQIPYTPSARRQVWHHKKYVGFECKAINNLPPGEHVLTLATNSSHEKHLTKISHVIMWP
jgi:hypothetical protein